MKGIDEKAIGYMSDDEIEEVFLDIEDDETAREMMLAIMDYEFKVSYDMAVKAAEYLTHKDRSMFTTAMQVCSANRIFKNTEWRFIRPLLSEDRQKIGDVIMKKDRP